MNRAAAGPRPGTDAGDRAGHNRLTHTAIRKTVESVTANAFRVATGNVSATLDDDAGKLGVSVSVKLALPQLLKPRNGGDTVFEQAQSAREQIVARGREITGLDIGRVDIRLTGGKAEQPRERRVE
ncbi:hypothetical protein SAMN05660916_03587 [Arthrobacter sp. 31Cvi3.1E]|nr:hypothetical protein SAMN05660916_03587 [Arthrobacter sp. 31Cvi3.1E]